MPQFGRPDGDITDERLQHILTEASSIISHKQPTPQPHHLIGSQLDDSRSMDDSKSPDHCMSPFSKDKMKYQNDAMSQEKVARMYQEEFAKLMGRSPNPGFPR